MPPSYQVRIYDHTGAVVAVTDRFRSAVIEHRVNYASTLTLALYEYEDVAILLAPDTALDYLVEFRRHVPEANLDWYTEYIGFHRTPQKQLTTEDSRIFTSYSRGLLDLINRRSVRYFYDVDCGLPNPTPADDVIKAMVRLNAGPDALITNGRATDGVTPGLTVADALSLAPEFQGDFQGKNLLDSIRDIGGPNKVDFDVVWGGHDNPLTFEFRTYYPFLGTDRTASGSQPTIFSDRFGNMAGPSLTKSRTDEITSALVVGELEDTTVRLSTHVTDSPWNLIEQDRDARGEDRETALNAMADEILHDKRPATSFLFDVIQTRYTTYGRHFFLGDMVTGKFSDLQADVKVRAVTLSISDEDEKLNLELEEAPS